MNFVNYRLVGVSTSKTQIVLCLTLSLLFAIYFAGCSDDVRLPSAEQLTRFQDAGPQQPKVDMDRLVNARIGGGPHRVLPGEVLELTMPTILQVVTAEEPEISGKTAPYVCRVGQAGTITLPVVGEIKVEGKTLAEIESIVTDAYYPEYTRNRPSVFARVTEYKTADVSVTGAVNKPGIYSLNSDRMSLVALLMEAGGIVDEGAAFIRIVHAEQDAPDNGQTRISSPGRRAGQSPELSQSKLSSLSAHHAGLDNIDVQLKFRPPAASDTRGALTVTYGQRILLTEQLDVSSEIERRALLERLIQREPRVSTAVVNQRLCALAETLRPASGVRNNQNEVANENVISVAKLEGNEVERRTSSERLAGTERWLSTAVGEQRLYAPAAPQLGYSLPASEYGTVGENTGQYEKLGAGDSQPVLAADEVRHESDLKKGLKTAGQVKAAEPLESRSLVLPVKGLNIPFADVALQDGDRVVVERLREPMITVVGLVNRAGNFPYPPDVEYNLMHALGFAGGLNLAAEPRYATVYRLAADGTTVSATFYIAGTTKGADPTDALTVPLKPYDVVAVEHTPRTRATVFWDRVFRVYISTYVTPDDIFGGD